MGFFNSIYNFGSVLIFQIHRDMQENDNDDDAALTLQVVEEEADKQADGIIWAVCQQAMAN